MIPIGELRIGNLVDLYGTIATIQRSDFKGEGIAVDKGKPIELTKEWLEDSGFKDGKIHLFEDYILEVAINAFSGTLKTGPKWFASIVRIASNDRITLIKNYVHELQNLYFALTNKELKTIK